MMQGTCYFNQPDRWGAGAQQPVKEPLKLYFGNLSEGVTRIELYSMLLQIGVIPIEVWISRDPAGCPFAFVDVPDLVTAMNVINSFNGFELIPGKGVLRVELAQDIKNSGDTASTTGILSSGIGRSEETSMGLLGMNCAGGNASKKKKGKKHKNSLWSTQLPTTNQFSNAGSVLSGDLPGGNLLQSGQSRSQTGVIPAWSQPLLAMPSREQINPQVETSKDQQLLGGMYADQSHRGISSHDELLLNKSLTEFARAISGHDHSHLGRVPAGIKPLMSLPTFGNFSPNNNGPGGSTQDPLKLNYLPLVSTKTVRGRPSLPESGEEPEETDEDAEAFEQMIQKLRSVDEFSASGSLHWLNSGVQYDTPHMSSSSQSLLQQQRDTQAMMNAHLMNTGNTGSNAYQHASHHSGSAQGESLQHRSHAPLLPISQYQPGAQPVRGYGDSVKPVLPMLLPLDLMRAKDANDGMWGFSNSPVHITDSDSFGGGRRHAPRSPPRHSTSSPPHGGSRSNTHHRSSTNQGVNGNSLKGSHPISWKPPRKRSPPKAKSIYNPTKKSCLLSKGISSPQRSGENRRLDRTPDRRRHEIGRSPVKGRIREERWSQERVRSRQRPGSPAGVSSHLTAMNPALMEHPHRMPSYEIPRSPRRIGNREQPRGSRRDESPLRSRNHQKAPQSTSESRRKRSKSPRMRGSGGPPSRYTRSPSVRYEGPPELRKSRGHGDGHHRSPPAGWIMSRSPEYSGRQGSSPRPISSGHYIHESHRHSNGDRRKKSGDRRHGSRGAGGDGERRRHGDGRNRHKGGDHHHEGGDHNHEVRDHHHRSPELVYRESQASSGGPMIIYRSSRGHTRSGSREVSVRSFLRRGSSHEQIGLDGEPVFYTRSRQNSPRGPPSSRRGHSPGRSHSLVHYRAHSPDVIYRERSPEIVYKERRSEIIYRERSPEILYRERSPEMIYRDRNPVMDFADRSPRMIDRSPQVIDRSPQMIDRSPRMVSIHRSPEIPSPERRHGMRHRDRSHKMRRSRRSPIHLEQRIPSLVTDRGSEIIYRERSPRMMEGSPGISYAETRGASSTMYDQSPGRLAGSLGQNLSESRHHRSRSARRSRDRIFDRNPPMAILNEARLNRRIHGEGGRGQSSRDKERRRSPHDRARAYASRSGKSAAEGIRSLLDMDLVSIEKDRRSSPDMGLAALNTEHRNSPRRPNKPGRVSNLKKDWVRGRSNRVRGSEGRQPLMGIWGRSIN